MIASSRGVSGLLSHLGFDRDVQNNAHLVNDSLAASSRGEVKASRWQRPDLSLITTYRPISPVHTDDAYSFLGPPPTFGPVELTSKCLTAPFIGVARLLNVTISAPTVGSRRQTSSFFSAVPYWVYLGSHREPAR